MGEEILQDHKMIPDLVVQASKGYTVDYPNGGSQSFADRYSKSSVTPNLQRVLDRVRKDSTLTAGVTTMVDRCMENGWGVRGRDQKSKEKKAITMLEDLRFNREVHKSLFHFILYRNAFFEPVMEGDVVAELNVLEPTLMRITADNHGEVSGYYQDVPVAKGSSQPSWTPDEIIHIKASNYTTSVWGDVDILTLERLLDTKESLKAHLHWLFATNQFRGFFAVEEGANDQQIADFMAYLKRTQYQIDAPLTLRGKVNYQVLRDFSDGPTFIALWQKIDEDILALLQVPPIFGGSAGGSNRSNSDTQVLTLNTAVKSIQARYAEAITAELLPKLGFEKAEFFFNPVDKKSQKDILEVALSLKNIGAKPETIESYLRGEGFDIGDGPMLFTPEELAAQAMAGKANLTGDPSMFPSRKGKTEGDSSKRIGTGSDGTTRNDQLVKQARWEYDFYTEGDSD